MREGKVRCTTGTTRPQSKAATIAHHATARRSHANRGAGAAITSYDSGECELGAGASTVRNVAHGEKRYLSGNVMRKRSFLVVLAFARSSSADAPPTAPLPMAPPPNLPPMTKDAPATPIA